MRNGIGWVAGAAVIVGTLGLAKVLLHQDSATPDPPVPAHSAIETALAVPKPGGPASSSPAGEVPESVPIDAMPTLPPETLKALREALREHPQREAEFKRIESLLRLQAQVDAFATAREQGASRHQLRSLALPIAQALPAQVAAGSVGGSEAVVLQAALLEVLSDSPEQARQRLTQWRDQHVPALAGNTPEEQNFLQAQAELARQQASPEALQRLREQHFR